MLPSKGPTTTHDKNWWLPRTYWQIRQPASASGQTPNARLFLAGRNGGFSRSPSPLGRLLAIDVSPTITDNAAPAELVFWGAFCIHPRIRVWASSKRARNWLTMTDGMSARLPGACHETERITTLLMYPNGSLLHHYWACGCSRSVPGGTLLYFTLI